METDPIGPGLSLVPVGQPTGEALELGVAPHPGREPLESGLGGFGGGLAAHASVDNGGVWPVCLDHHDVEAMTLYQPASDGGSRAVELGRAVARFSK